MNKAKIVRRKPVQEIETMSNPLFRCLLLFSAFSAESHKKIYLSVLCVSAVNYCYIFKCIVPLTPEATPQVTEQATMQDERIKK